jgi:hypothetical protein
MTRQRRTSGGQRNSVRGIGESGVTVTLHLIPGD